ncbi:MAG: hypothetical protein QOF48_926 [Verrucomicrobiota bacterium]|jgi:hypothetical protein
MDTATFNQSPFAVLTFIAAPAVLTNAASVLAMSTINRMLRTRDRMRELFIESQHAPESGSNADRLLRQVNRVERQAAHLLRALHAIYVALAGFAAASLVTLLGAVLGNWEGLISFRVLAGCGLSLGFVGVGGLILGCWNLLQATRLSLANIREDAALIRAQQEQVRKNLSAGVS